jgi:hypothetical protein
MVTSMTSMLILLFYCLLLLFTLQQSGIKAIFWSVTVYYKYLSNQCNLTSQINRVQDRFPYITIAMSNSLNKELSLYCDVIQCMYTMFGGVIGVYRFFQ